MAQNTHKPSFEQIYETHYSQVWRFLLHAAADVETALELTSRVFFRVLRAWPRFEPSAAPVDAWLIRIALNEWRRELRKRKLSRLVPLIHLSKAEDESKDLDTHEVNAAVEVLEKDEEYQMLRRALSSLPRKYETPIMLHYFEHMTLEQVADVLGRPVGTVKSLIHRGIARLRQNQGLRESLGLSFSEAEPITMKEVSP
jgi:RNA polymerase sigma-70 factor (ECF subfamily)